MTTVRVTDMEYVSMLAWLGEAFLRIDGSAQLETIAEVLDRCATRTFDYTDGWFVRKPWAPDSVR